MYILYRIIIDKNSRFEKSPLRLNNTLDCAFIKPVVCSKRRKKNRDKLFSPKNQMQNCNRYQANTFQENQITNSPLFKKIETILFRF